MGKFALNNRNVLDFEKAITIVVRQMRGKIKTKKNLVDPVASSV